jgi:predicted dehydrogenase
VNDNFAATIRFDDGSVCQLLYTALGESSWPKERMELFCDQKVFELDDYLSAARAGGDKPLWSGTADKGHATEIAKLHAALRTGAAWPISLWQQIQATDIAFQVERALSVGAPTAQGRD